MNNLTSFYHYSDMVNINEVNSAILPEI